MAFDHGHALLIGVGTYVYHPEANVPITVNDAQAVQDALQDPARCGYLPAQVTLLHDASAGRAEILRQLEHLVQVVRPDDTVTIFYCGHGSYGTDGNYYLTTHDTRGQGDKIVAGSGISAAELLGALRKIRARRLLLLFNACHSGEISPSLGSGAPAPFGSPMPFGALSLPSPAAEALLSSGEGRILITACRPEQLSQIGTGKLTLFAQALVDGLSGRGSVVNSQGYISAFSLYEHIYRAVKAAAENLKKLQEPELTVLKGVGPFPVALYRGATDLGTFDAAGGLPPGTAVRQVEPAISQYRFQQMGNIVSASNGGVAVGGDMVGSFVNTGKVDGPVYNIQGGIHSGRDTNLGDQYNYNIASQEPRTQDEFAAALASLQAQIAELKRQPGLTTVQQFNIQVAEGKLAEAADQAKLPAPAGGRIQAALKEAKEFLDVVSGSLQSAVNLGTIIGTLASLAIKLFGG